MNGAPESGPGGAGERWDGNGAGLGPIRGPEGGAGGAHGPAMSADYETVVNVATVSLGALSGRPLQNGARRQRRWIYGNSRKVGETFAFRERYGKMPADISDRGRRRWRRDSPGRGPRWSGSS